MFRNLETLSFFGKNIKPFEIVVPLSYKLKLK